MAVTRFNTTSLPQDKAWQSPKLTVLGDIGSLTETGSAAGSESPWGLCLDSINMTGNACTMA